VKVVFIFYIVYPAHVTTAIGLHWQKCNAQNRNTCTTMLKDI